MILFKNKWILKLFLEISPCNSKELLFKKIIRNSKRLKSTNLFSVRWCSKYRIIFLQSHNTIYIFSLSKRENVYKSNLTKSKVSITSFKWIELK